MNASVRTIARVRKQFVTEGLDAALDPKPRPARPDKIKIKGDVEQKLIKLAWTDPPRGRCHWTLQLLADKMVVLVFGEVRPPESARPGAPTESTTSTSGKGFVANS